MVSWWRSDRGGYLSIQGHSWYKTLIFFIVCSLLLLGGVKIGRVIWETQYAWGTEQIKKVQADVTSIGGVSRSVTHPLAASVNIDKSFLLFGNEGVSGAGTLPVGTVTGEFGSVRTLYLARNDPSG